MVSNSLERLIQKQFGIIMDKLNSIEWRLEKLENKSKAGLVIKEKTWEDAEIRFFNRHPRNKVNEYKFGEMKRYYSNKGKQFEDLTEDDLIEFGHIKDESCAPLTINNHRIFCRLFSKSLYPDIFTKDLYEFFHTIKHPHRKKTPPLPTDEEIEKIKHKLQKLDLTDEDDLMLFIQIALPFEICDRRTLYSDLKKKSFFLDTIENSYVRYNYGKYKQDNAKAIKSPKLLDALKRIFKKFPPEYFPYLFTGKNGENVNDKTLTRNFKKFCGFNTHAVRYKYATKLYQNGYSLERIAEMLGIQKQTLKHYIQEKQLVQIQNTREIPNIVLI